MTQQQLEHDDLDALLLANVRDSVVVTDLDGVVTYWNEGATRLFGWTAAEMLGHPMTDRVPPEARPAIAERLAELRAGGEFAGEWQDYHKDGSRVWIEARVALMHDRDGQPIGFLGVSHDVTERKKVEDALRQSEERFRELFENAADALYTVDLQGHFTSANAAAERLTGYSLEELLRMKVPDLMSPEQLQRSVKMLEAKLTGGNRTVYELELLTKDGRRRYVQISSRLIVHNGQPVGVQGIARDLTEQKRADEAIRASEQRFRAITEHSWDAVGLLAADGTALYASPATSRLLGFGPVEVVGHNAFALMHPDEAGPARAAFVELVATPGAVRTSTFRLRHRDGSWRWIEGTATNLLHEPGVEAVVANYHDVTELRQRAAELADENRRKDEFLAMLGHELRNPLAPIRNAVEVLRRSRGDERGWTAGVIDRQVRHLTRLVDDLLDVSRITRGMVKLQRELVDVGRVVADAVETCLPQLDGRRQQLAVDVAPGLWVEGDPLRLAQVIGNVLTNASKYSGDEGHVWLSAACEGGEVVLRIRDDGIGIRAEMLPRIFDLFIQAESAIQQSLGGLGIGLTLVKRLIEFHGGRVEAYSAGPGRGSEFVLRLPAAEAAPPTPVHAVEGPAVAPIPSRRVLVVDDNIDHAETLAMILRLDGHEVRAVHEAAAVLDAARAFRPDAVLLDIGLPGALNGYDVARHLRTLPDQEKMSLIALTGYGQEEDRRRADEAGFDYHVVKPADPAALQELIGKGRRDTRNECV